MVYAACSVIFLSGMMVIWYNVTDVFENASLIMNNFAFPFLIEYILVCAMDGYSLSKSRGIWWLMLAWHKLSYREPLHKDQWSIGTKTQADFFTADISIWWCYRASHGIHSLYFLTDHTASNNE